MQEPNFENADDEETIISTVELREMESLSEEITTVIVEHADVSSEQIGPLERYIDTDALDNLFSPVGARESPVTGHLSFRFEDWHVDIDSNGYFQIKQISECHR